MTIRYDRHEHLPLELTKGALMALPESYSGPWVAAACFCETVITGNDGVLTLVRVIDAITQRVIVQDPAQIETVDQAAVLKATLVVMLKAGSARGQHNLTVQIYAPSGLKWMDPLEGNVYLEGDDRGTNVLIPFETRFPETGVYWFSIRFDDQLLTRTPLRVLIERPQVAGR